MALRAKNKLTACKLLAGGFSKDGAQVYGIVRNTMGEGAEWQLYAIDVKTGAEKMLAPLDLLASTDGVAGFSLHPDGNRFLTSIDQVAVRHLGARRLRSDAAEDVAGPSVAEPRLHAEPRDLVKLTTGCAVSPANLCPSQ